MDQQYQHYERVALVAHSPTDMDKYRPEAQQVAEYCSQWGMRYEEILGSDSYVRQLIKVAADLGQANDDFLIIQPGGEISQDHFFR
jgi:hypothetical protein